MYFFPAKPKLITLQQDLFQKLNGNQNFVGELKYKGDRLELITPDGGKTFQWWNRHGSIFKFNPSAKLLESVKPLKLKGFCQLDGELLDHKTVNVKNTPVLFDVIVFNGELQNNKTFRQRREMLWTIFGKPELIYDTPEIGVVNIAPQWPTGEFQDVYDEYTQIKWIEGLVMKNLEAKLITGRTSCPTVATMYKVRKPENAVMRW
jgi:ATP-dependent DNA ligase